MRKRSRIARFRRPGRARLNQAFVWLAFLAVVATGVGAAKWVGDRSVSAAVDPEKHCFLHRQDPAVEALLVDTSDPMVRAQSRTATQVVEDILASLPTGGRFALIESDPRAPTETDPVFDACKPGADGNLERRQGQEEFQRPVLDLLERMQGRPPAPQSPLVETIVAISSDRSLRTDDVPLTIRVLTDGLQNSDLWSSYDPLAIVPEPGTEALRDVRVEIILLRNPRDAHLQRKGVRDLVRWLQQAGATVRCREPPWMALLAAEGSATLP
jgi:hypothetical protein